MTTLQARQEGEDGVIAEHDKLRAVIADARRWTTPGKRHGLATDRLGEWLNILADAAESTLPPTKMVEVWHVEWVLPNGSGFTLMCCPHVTEDRAREQATRLGARPMNTCIRITGPRAHEVPA